MIDATIAAIREVDAEAGRQAQRALDAKTKPRRSLGRLEDLASRLAAIYRTPQPSLPSTGIIVMAGDHGVTAEGVSAYPSEVTTQMVRNYAAGGAAINVLARQARAKLVVVDMGSKSPAPPPPGVLDRRLGPGTCNFAAAPAMSRQQAVGAVETGIELVREARFELIAVGEMGIGNTTSAAALAAVFTGQPPERVTGFGTGIDEAGRRRKLQAIERGLALHRPDPTDPVGVLAQLGGFEIAGLTGVILGAAARSIPVVLDGFITGAAALAAVRLCPAVHSYLIAGHCSVEPGHRIVLDTLGLTPLLDVEMRLGEGTGAALALHLVEASLRILNEMATFDSAGVTDAGA